MNENTLNNLINLFALFLAISESGKEYAIHNFSLYLQQHFGRWLRKDEQVMFFLRFLELVKTGNQSYAKVV